MKCPDDVGVRTTTRFLLSCDGPRATLTTMSSKHRDRWTSFVCCSDFASSRSDNNKRPCTSTIIQIPTERNSEPGQHELRDVASRHFLDLLATKLAGLRSTSRLAELHHLRAHPGAFDTFASSELRSSLPTTHEPHDMTVAFCLQARQTSRRTVQHAKRNSPTREAVPADMPPRQESLQTLLHSADPAHGRPIADAIAEKQSPGQAQERLIVDAVAQQRTEPKRQQRPRSGQRPPRQSAGAPAAVAQHATGAQGDATSDLSRVEERVGKAAGGQPTAPPSKRRRDPQPGSRGAVSGSVPLTASGGARRSEGSSGSDAASAAAAAQREVIRQTGREVQELCDEARKFCEMHCEFDAEGTPGLDGDVGPMMVTELHELQERLEDALEDVLELPKIAYTDRLRSRIDDKLCLLGELVEELEERNELCTRPDCWHGHFDSDSESAEDNGLWARISCAYDNPYYDSDEE